MRGTFHYNTYVHVLPNIDWFQSVNWSRAKGIETINHLWGEGLNNLWGFTWFSGGNKGGLGVATQRINGGGGRGKKGDCQWGEVFRILQSLRRDQVYFFLRHDRPKATNNRLADSFLLQIFIAVFLSWAWLAFCFCCFKSDIFHWAVACWGPFPT